MLIGITGSIACGKSTIITYLKKKGYDVLDCDEIAFDVVQKGRAAYYQIIHIFSKDILTNKNDIDRKKLANIVFNDPEKKKILEEVIHPRVVRDLQFKSKKKTWYVEIPLLFEASLEHLFKKIIVVTVKEELQIERLCERNKIDQKSAVNLIRNQMSQDEKIKRADYVIDNSNSLIETYKQIENIIELIGRSKENEI